ITKVFTSTLLAQAVGAEQVQLDQDIRTLGLEKLWVKDSISLLNLANHSSGLPRMPSDIFLTPNIDHQNPFKGYTGEILEAYLAEKVHLDHPPGEQYAYSNLGAGLLGYLLAKQADMNYPELLQRQIFDPIGMKNSGCERADFPDQVVPALGVTGDTVPHWDWQSLAGAGVILSTVEDLGKFVKQHFEQEDAALNLTREPTLRVSPKLNIGLGWHIIRGKDNREVHWHNGGTAGFSSHLSMDMETEQAVIILSNVSAYHPKMRRIDQMGFRLLKRL
ncbi:MAG: serine hydrolase domain-containing protein, partial [Bacteroidota bacterium]